MSSKKTKIKFIAEIGINHNGNFSLAKKLIYEANKCGCDYVKFQIRNLNKIYHKNFKKNFTNSESAHQYIFNQLKKSNFSTSKNLELFRYAKKLGLKVMITPFDNFSANLCKSSLVDAIKIGSPDFENIFLIKKCLSFNKSIFLSTGMSSEENIISIIKFLKKNKKKNQDITILHCASSYPPLDEEINIRYINNLKNISKNFKIGYSGHERGYGPSLISLFYGVSVIERHITLNKKEEGPDHNSSLLPIEFLHMVKKTEIIKKYLNEKKISEENFLKKFNLLKYKNSIGISKKIISINAEYNKKILGKSLVYKKDYQKGKFLDLNCLKLVSPAKGISAVEFIKIKKKMLETNVNSLQYLQLEDFKKNKKKNIKINRKWGLVGRLGDFEEFLDQKSDLIEIHLTWRELINPKKTRKKIDKELIFHAPEYFNDQLIDFSTDDKKILNNSFEMMEHLSKLVDKMKDNFLFDEKLGPKVVLHPGGHSEKPLDYLSKISRYRNLYKNIKKIKSKNYNLLLENMPPYPWYFGGSYFQHIFTDTNEIKKFCSEAKTGLCYDTSHAILECNNSKKDFINFTKKIVSHASYFHISDGKGKNQEGVQVGLGDINFEKFFDLIKNNNAGFIPEIWNGHLNSGRGFEIALRNIQKILKKISIKHNH